MWSTNNGNIISSTTSSIQVNKPGTYTIQSAIAQGCPVIRTDVVTVAMDTFPPVASFTAAPTGVNQIVLHGGDTAASNYNTPFGTSQGLLWNWSGPNGFTATSQNPVNSNVTGAYQLILTEMRNGCTDTVSNVISFVVLSAGTSNVARVNKVAEQSYVLAGTSLSANPRLIVNTKEAMITKVMVHNLAGQAVYTKQEVLRAGQNYIELPVRGRKDKLLIVSLFINNKVAFSGKAIF